ncbi:MAG: proton-conducting transporter membrane subunit [Bacteroidota bacterium]
MQQILQLFIWLPLAGFLTSLLIPKKKEKIISGIAIISAAIHLVACTGFILFWLWNGHAALDIKHIVLYKTTAFEFFIDFYFDKTTAVFAFVGSLIILLVSVFSRFYMHRDGGFKRFFNTFLLFFLGYNLVVFSGNFETLFIGWEILGFCSFLLIAFYRDRYLPVKNALKIISIYRLGDVCLMLAMWMCHHLFHENITFNQLQNTTLISDHLTGNTSLFIFIAIMILIAASAKSALLPFSSWLPRAMEGPTTSSAVFYGSLSVHLGAFLLIRTLPFWENIPVIKFSVIILGALTSIICASIAKIQSTVKTQIAYSSVTQIGLIFIEVALGFHTLALIHFAGNAFLRTYQLLVSPSVLSYRIHDMFFSFTPTTRKRGNVFLNKLNNSFFILGIKEWSLDWLMYRFLWSPFKWIGRNMNFMVKRVSVVILSAFFLLGLFSFAAKDNIPDHFDNPMQVIFSFTGLLLILTAFAERGDARRAWSFVLAGQGFVTLSIAFNEAVAAEQVIMYLSGVICSAVAGYICLTKMKSIDNDIALNKFHGYAYEKPALAFAFLLCSLGTIGFPFTPTFIGIDLLFTHIHKDQLLLIILTSLSFIFIELSILRIYARIFLGQHKKNNHPIAYRSS